jgi:hypothetical protein
MAVSATRLNARDTIISEVCPQVHATTLMEDSSVVEMESVFVIRNRALISGGAIPD